MPLSNRKICDNLYVHAKRVPSVGLCVGTAHSGDTSSASLDEIVESLAPLAGEERE